MEKRFFGKLVIYMPVNVNTKNEKRIVIHSERCEFGADAELCAKNFALQNKHLVLAYEDISCEFKFNNEYLGDLISFLK